MAHEWEPGWTDPYAAAPAAPTASAPPAQPPLAPTVATAYAPHRPSPPRRPRRSGWIVACLVGLAYLAWHWEDVADIVEGFRAGSTPAYALPTVENLSAEAPEEGYALFGSDDLARHLERELMAHTARIDVTEWTRLDEDFDTLWDAWDEVLAQNPYLYVDTGHAYRVPGRVELRPTYTYSAEESERRRALTVSAARAGLEAAGVADAPDDAAKVGLIYDYIAAVAEYDYTAADEIEQDISSGLVAHSQEAYAILVDGYAVCAGYSKAFIAMAHEAGLEAVEVTGSDTAGRYGGSHAWNKVLVDGRWLLVDITWDDEGSYAGDDYLLLPDDADILDTRTADLSWMNDARVADYRG
ncbi:transglutaminase domain-containing protein [Demequina sp. SYSU T00192]|uniref:Transglutaminase domain-containing protein n=1 Tax=Demequina litoralis TaxID=3051660 RepID=A0ABT8GAT6_9MICO|nr:transglutaminase domain-containing protein [Demequina sp. SYSU T00192]MDN4476241.1 transglutaminase domain-containing protein [Demequina sp. SYSU T00192]